MAFSFIVLDRGPFGFCFSLRGYHGVHANTQKPAGRVDKLLRRSEHLLIFLNLLLRKAGEVFTLNTADEKGSGYDIVIP